MPKILKYYNTPYITSIIPENKDFCSGSGSGNGGVVVFVVVIVQQNVICYHMSVLCSIVLHKIQKLNPFANSDNKLKTKTKVK